MIENTDASLPQIRSLTAFRSGMAAGLLGALAYGVNIPFASLAQKAGVSAQQMSFYRSLAMAAVLLLVLIILRRNLLPQLLDRTRVILAGLCSGGVALSYLASVKYNPVALSVVLLYTYPLIIILIEAFMTKRWPPALRLGVFIVSFIGIVIAVGPNLSGASAFGAGLALTAGFSSALLYVIAARIKDPGFASMLTMQIIVLGMSAGMMIAAGDSFNPTVFSLAPWSSFLSMAGYAVGFFSIIYAAPRTGSTNLGLVFLIEPVIGIVSAMLVLEEIPTLVQWLGVAIILGALAVDAVSQPRQNA
jgi:drug/metabolite transporter (DMT)-like permease